MWHGGGDGVAVGRMGEAAKGGRQGRRGRRGCGAAGAQRGQTWLCEKRREWKGVRREDAAQFSIIVGYKGAYPLRSCCGEDWLAARWVYSGVDVV